jgi:excisionase family DNA binding protein
MYRPIHLQELNRHDHLDNDDQLYYKSVSHSRGRHLVALVGVRRAADLLGVHENTLRRWEQKGLIKAVKLPTGVRRFRREDVERLRNEMWDEVIDDSSVPAGDRVDSAK